MNSAFAPRAEIDFQLEFEAAVFFFLIQSRNWLSKSVLTG
jgi:hypothetical protein